LSTKIHWTGALSLVVMAKKNSKSRVIEPEIEDPSVPVKWPPLLKPYGKSTIGVAKIRRVVREVKAELRAAEAAANGRQR
jgi:hypothetical protein